MMQKRWFIRNTPDSELVTALCDQLNISLPMGQLLVQRGIHTYEDAHRFFRPQLDNLHDPFLLPDMKEAVDCLNSTLQNDEKILLFGDYDVDGTTAVALCWSVLSQHTDKLDFYIPDRYTEGYGLSQQGIDYAVANGFSLLITLDCGVKSNELIQQARERGLSVIVCDHHEPGEQLPPCWVLDPKRKDSLYPYHELSGCGVGFKLMHALYLQNKWDDQLLWQQLDLVAVSIAADIVPITGENRTLCFHGLNQLNKQPRPGIEALLEGAQKTLPLTLTDVVFTIAPRINAAGRIHTGRKAVALLISGDWDDLRVLAQSIHENNLERRELDAEITTEALSLLAETHGHTSAVTTVVFQPHWHKGVIGIVASRLQEHYYRPTIVLTESNGKLTGSGRSIQGLDLHQALHACSEHLEQFGGHAFAAGMTLLPEQLAPFRDAFNRVVAATLAPEHLVPQQEIDVEIQFSDLFAPGESIQQIPKFKRILQQLEPHGPGNMKPVFITKNVFIYDVRLLKDAHLKLEVRQAETPFSLPGIGFNLADKYELCQEGLPVDLVYTLETNRWQNRETLQLNIKDIRLS